MKERANEGGGLATKSHQTVKSLFHPKWRLQVPPGERWDVSDGGRAWGEAGLSRFESAHDADDSTYEHLIHDIPTG
jgi:hypothetical protein